MNSNFSLARRGPDAISEELVRALLLKRSYEFKELFTAIHPPLLERKVSGGEEMMRLRSYDKLQGLVLHGQVKKTGKRYRGLKKPLELFAEDLKALTVKFAPGLKKWPPVKAGISPAAK